MAAKTVNLELDAGATQTLALTLKNEDGTAFDLTSCTRLEFVARQAISDTATTISKTLSSGVSIVSASAGTATVTLTSSDTLSLSGRHSYDVHAVVSGSRYVVLRGTITFLQAVNRS